MWQRAVITLCLLLSGSLAWGHATLLASSPAAGSVLAQAPDRVELTFNEPVAVGVLQLYGPQGNKLAIGSVRSHDQQIIVNLPAYSATGSYLFSWRVVSADGHPVGGILNYAIGEGNASSPAAMTLDRSEGRNVAIWLGRWLSYLLLFSALGLAVFRIIKADSRVAFLVPLCLAGIALIFVNLGLQGLDLLAVSVKQFFYPKVWLAALGTSYAITLGGVGLVYIALVVAIRRASATTFAIWVGGALLLAGVAIAASGHVSTASPHWLSRLLVVMHIVSVVLWVGLLWPLFSAFKRTAASPPDNRPLMIFSRWIPFVVALLLASGGGMMLLQLRHPSDLWHTHYGWVLSVKLMLVACLLLVAAFNRWRFTRPALDGVGEGSKMLRRMIVVEILLAIIILGVVSLWRFTPPPRAMDMADHRLPFAAVTLKNHRVNARIEPTMMPHQWRAMLFDSHHQPFAAQAVTLRLQSRKLKLADTQSGELQHDHAWLFNLPSLPVVDDWEVTLVILVNDFEQISLDSHD